MNIIPSGRHIVEFLASRPEFVGVGRAKAKRLWDRFGSSLYTLLGNGEVEALSEIIDRSQAAIVVAAWRNQQALADCVVFFDEQGIDIRVARKAVDFWGEDAVAKIRDNPYRLLTVCTWSQIDHAALRLGRAKDDPRRLVAAVESALYDRLDRKHTWSSRTRLIGLVSERLKVDAALSEKAIDMAVADAAAIAIEKGFQPAGAAYMERYIEARIKAHAERSGDADLFLDSIVVDRVEEFISKFRQTDPLTEEQASAVRMALANTFSLLVGGAGVGKTTALKAINAAARQFGMVVYQLAIAGRAAHRIAEATGQEARTVASWIRGVSHGKLEVGRHTLVIIDEASMLDLPTLYRVLFHLPDETPILLVGDTAQLPPIGFGLTLHRLVAEKAIPKTELTKILRSSETSGIPATSRAIRQGAVPDIPRYTPEGIGCMVVRSTEDEILGILDLVIDDLGDEEVQIVAATYGGKAGIEAINEHFHRRNVRRGAKANFGFAVADPCLWTVNDYDRNLWNGSLGCVVDVTGTTLIAEFNAVRYELAVNELDRLELAYAISVHKAQGSQFQNVVMPIVRSLNLDRALLYTAVTRATDRAVLVGSAQVLDAAIRDEPRSLDREVALRLRDLKRGTG